MRRRLAYWCETCVALRAKDPNLVVAREFIQTGQPVPRCPVHGIMKRQENNAYKGRAVA